MPMVVLLALTLHVYTCMHIPYVVYQILFEVNIEGLFPLVAKGEPAKLGCTLVCLFVLVKSQYLL
jgi:hypothetical protein